MILSDILAWIRHFDSLSFQTYLFSDLSSRCAGFSGSETMRMRQSDISAYRDQHFKVIVVDDLFVPLTKYMMIDLPCPPIL